MKMKIWVTLDGLCAVVSTTAAVLNALQDKWEMTVICSLGALCWVVVGISDYKKILKMRS